MQIISTHFRKCECICVLELPYNYHKLDRLKQQKCVLSQRLWQYRCLHLTQHPSLWPLTNHLLLQPGSQSLFFLKGSICLQPVISTSPCPACRISETQPPSLILSCPYPSLHCFCRYSNLKNFVCPPCMSQGSIPFIRQEGFPSTLPCLFLASTETGVPH